MPKARRKSAFVIFNLTVSAALLMLGAAFVAFVHQTLRASALAEAEQHAHLILDHNLAIHEYFADTLKPSVFALSERIEGPDYFDPAWMSSTYAVEEIGHLFGRHLGQNFGYKEAAIDARNPAHEATPIEAAFIHDLNRDAGLQSRAAVREIDGKRYFTVMHKGETIQTSCLQCHGDPADAPAGLIALYGAERGFGRTVGQVVSATSIRVPLGTAYAEADRLSTLLATALVFGVLAIMGLQAWVGRWAFVTPLKRLEDKVVDIAEGRGAIGDQVPVPETAELGNLTEAFNDMSRRLREVAEDREATLSRLRRTTAEIERIAHVSSHDLKEPLRMVTSYVQLLEKRYADTLDDQGRTYIAFAVEGAKRMHALIGDLLAFTRADAADRPRAVVDLDAVVDEAIDRLGTDAEADDDIEITRVRAPGSPWVSGDHALLARAVGAVLDNAVRYRSADRPLRVAVRVTPEAGGWSVTVTDNGVGIDLAYQDRIFWMFERLADPIGQPGTGIGLTLVKKIVESHGGRVSLASAPDEGTTVTLWLPGKPP